MDLNTIALLGGVLTGIGLYRKDKKNKKDKKVNKKNELTGNYEVDAEVSGNVNTGENKVEVKASGNLEFDNGVDTEGSIQANSKGDYKITIKGCSKF